jgi:hypothetical protein
MSETLRIPMAARLYLRDGTHIERLMTVFEKPPVGYVLGGFEGKKYKLISLQDCHDGVVALKAIVEEIT